MTWTFIFFLLHEWISCAGEPSVIDSLTFQIENEIDDPSENVSTTPSMRKEIRIAKNAHSSQKNTTLHPTDRPCPGIVCFVKKIESKTIFDCQPTTEKANKFISKRIICTYWQKPQALNPAKFSEYNQKSLSSSEDGTDTFDITNSMEPIRIRLRPWSDDGQYRIYANEAESGALLRLCKTIRSNLKLEESLPLKISLMMLRIDKLNWNDLSSLFTDANVNNLILWNPIEIEDTSLLPPKQTELKDANLVRITLHCEPDNVKPAFNRLWIPWIRWIIHFRHCEGKFSCYPWPNSSPLCCENGRCPKVPQYVILPTELKTNKPSLIANNFQSEQLVSYSNCEMEPTLSSPLVNLKFAKDCWSTVEANEAYDDVSTGEDDEEMVTTTLQPTNSSTTVNMIIDTTSVEINNELSTGANVSQFDIIQENTTTYVSYTTQTPTVTNSKYEIIHTQQNVLGYAEYTTQTSTVTNPTHGIIHTQQNVLIDAKHTTQTPTVTNPTHGIIHSQQNVLSDAEYAEKIQLRNLTVCVISLMIINILIFITMFMLFCWISRKWKSRKLDENVWFNWQSNQDSNSASSCISKLDDFPKSSLRNSAVFSNGSGYKLIIPKGSPCPSSPRHRSMFISDRISSSNKSSPHNMRKASPIQAIRQGKQHTMVMDSTIDPQLFKPSLHPL